VLLLCTVVVSGVPNGYAWGCLNISKTLPFCDHTVPLAARVNDLVGRLSLNEQLGLIGPDPRTGVDTCNFMDAGVVRLGIPPYMHLVETNTAVASACYAPFKCATEFPGPTGLGASFNRSMWFAKGDAISSEMRAFNNLNWHRATGDAPKSLIGLTGFGPNINIVRDPRFGRNSELPSEDPFHSGTYATNYVQGCQQHNNSYLKMVSGLKHFDAYSVEDNRAGRSFNISMFDLWDTFLPQYRLGFVEGGAHATMCSYASINGVPSCANNYLLNEVVRGIWNRPDVVVGTDCGAVSNMIHANHYASSPEDAAAKSINSGTDMELGDTFFSPLSSGGQNSLQMAIDKGLTTADRVRTAVSRILTKRFLLGQFDPLALQPYTTLGLEMINSTEHQALNFDAALQSMVLLHNDGVLPLAPGRRVAVVGPHSISQRDLIEDYAGDQRCFDGTDTCIPTIGEMLTRYNVGGTTTVAKGVDMNSGDASGIPAALAAARSSDVVVLCLGIGHNEEHEAMDRTNITLPGLQYSFAQQIIALGKPVVLVLVNGGAVAIDGISTNGIIEAFYPSMRGAEALAHLVFGLANRWGKLPVTLYPAAYVSEVSMYSFDMSLAPGRTYRYYTGTPLFPFGFGLSYTTFATACKQTATTFACTVTNTGARDGDQVLLVYHRASDAIRHSVSHPVPLRGLVDFNRVAVGRGATEPVEFTVADSYTGLTNAAGEVVQYAGVHYIDISDGVSPAITFTITVTQDRILSRSSL